MKSGDFFTSSKTVRFSKENITPKIHSFPTFAHKAGLCSRIFHLKNEFLILIYSCKGEKREGDKGTKGTKRVR
jgi:hypothetical protein